VNQKVIQLNQQILQTNLLI